MKKKIALIFGGESTEHNVSVLSAQSIVSNISYDQYDIFPIYIDKKGAWFVHMAWEHSYDLIECLKDFEHLHNPFMFLKTNTDIAFPIIHGTSGEDGKLQGLLELVGIPFVGCDSKTSALCMDKDWTKKMLNTSNIPQVEHLTFSDKDIENDLTSICTEVELFFGFPCFVKPCSLGSSIGAQKVTDRESLSIVLREACEFDHKVMIERYVKIRELEIGLLGSSELLLSEVGEIVTNADFYDYEAKYIDKENTSLQIPADISESTKEKIIALSSLIAKKLSLNGLSRIDFFYDELNELLYFNEVNTIPGFTPRSMYPLLFEKVGIEFPELIQRLIEDAELNFRQNQKKQEFTKKHMNNQ